MYSFIHLFFYIHELIHALILLYLCIHPFVFLYSFNLPNSCIHSWWFTYIQMGTVSYMYIRKIVVQTQVRVSFFIREFIHSSIFMYSFILLYSCIHSFFFIHVFIQPLIFMNSFINGFLPRNLYSFWYKMFCNLIICHQNNFFLLLSKRKWVSNSDFLNPISLQPNFVEIRYLKHLLFLIK